VTWPALGWVGVDGAKTSSSLASVRSSQMGNISLVTSLNWMLDNEGMVVPAFAPFVHGDRDLRGRGCHGQWIRCPWYGSGGLGSNIHGVVVVNGQGWLRQASTVPPHVAWY